MSRLTTALSVALLGAALLATPVHAQGRGMRGSAPARRGGSLRLRGKTRFTRTSHRGFFDGSGFYPDYDSSEEPFASGEPPPQVVVAQPAQSPSPVAGSVDSLLLEERDGKWVRVPTGSQMPVGPQSTQLGSAEASGLRPGPRGAPQLAPELPPAVLIFRDGHTEEVKRYTIQGGVLYAKADYWSTGSWTRRIPITELDVPASLKLNAERGARFNLPSGPNEIVVRF